MTTRTTWVIRCFAWSLPVLLAIAIAWRALHPEVIRYKNHVSQIKMVGLALKLYADDHQGVLPLALDDLTPEYFSKREVLQGVQYVTPGAKLPELPPQTVIACRPYPEDHLVGEIHADLSAETHRF